MITHELLKERFDYADGQLIRRVSTASRAMVGSVAGYLAKDGYIRTRTAGKNYLNHRLIWLWHHGYFPENDLDHIDRNRRNNRINNLREVSRTCNIRNTGNKTTNTSGIKGVGWSNSRRKWRAQIQIKGKAIHLGIHADLLEVACHRLAAEQCLGWHRCEGESTAFRHVQEYLSNRADISRSTTFTIL